MSRQREQESQSKHWEGTVYGQTTEEFLKKLQEKSLKYAVIGKEICPSTGRHHLQVFFSLHRKIRMGTLASFLNATIFPLRRQISEAINYIIDNPEKPNPDFVEWGERPSSYRARNGDQNHRNPNGADSRLATNREIVQLAKEGKFDTIEEKFPGRYLLSYNVLKKIHCDNIPRPNKDLVKGLWLIGPSGCGKSYWLRKHFENEACYPYNKIDAFFERYNLESVLTIDELDRSHKWILNHLKVWCNENLTLLNVKHGSCWSYFTKIICTSQYTPSRISGDSNDLELIEAMDRRFVRFMVHGRDEKLNDLLVTFEEGPHLFPFSLNNYLFGINFL